MQQRNYWALPKSMRWYLRQQKQSRQPKSGTSSKSSRPTSRGENAKLRAAYDQLWAFLVVTIQQQGRVRIPLESLAQVRRDQELSITKGPSFLTIEIKDANVSVPETGATQ